MSSIFLRERDEGDGCYNANVTIVTAMIDRWFDHSDMIVDIT